MPAIKEEEISFQTNESKIFLYNIYHIFKSLIDVHLFSLRIYSEVIVLLL